MLLKLHFIIRPFCLPRDDANTQRQVTLCDSPHLRTDMHVSSRRWRDGARGRHHSVHDNCSTTCSQAKARATTKRVPRPPPLGLPREAMRVYVVNGVLDEVLQEVPRRRYHCETKYRGRMCRSVKRYSTKN